MDATIKLDGFTTTEGMAAFAKGTTIFSERRKTWAGRKKPKAQPKPADPFADEHPEKPKMKGKRKTAEEKAVEVAVGLANKALQPHRNLYQEFYFVCDECGRKYQDWDEHRQEMKDKKDDGIHCTKPAELMVKCALCTYPNGAPFMFNPVTSTHAYEHRVNRHFPGENQKWNITCPFCKRKVRDYINHHCDGSEFYGSMDDCYWKSLQQSKKQAPDRMQ